MLISQHIAPVAVPRELDPAPVKTDAGAAAALRAMVPSASRPQLHLNPADVGLYDEDTGRVRMTLVDLLHTPKAWRENSAAWFAQMKPGHRHLEYARSLAPGYTGSSIEGEQLCPVGHDERPWEAWVRAYPSTGRARYGEAIASAMKAINAAVRNVVVPYGAGQVLPAHIRPRTPEHRTQLGNTVAWYGYAGPLASIPTSQQFYMPYPTMEPGVMIEWVHAALSIQHALGHTWHRKVFLNVEIDGAPGSGEADEFPCMDPDLLGMVLGVIDAHHAAASVVQWFRVGTVMRAQRWAQSLEAVAAILATTKVSEAMEGNAGGDRSVQ